MTARKLAPRRQRKPRSRSAVQTVVDETIALHRWLEWVAERLYGDAPSGSARRWILRRVDRQGPQSVAMLARARAVRRQSLQSVVEGLVEGGLLAASPNPRHRRSPLFALTERGRLVARRLDRVDGAVLRAVSRAIAQRDLETTAATLRALRSAFETRTRWMPAATRAL